VLGCVVSQESLERVLRAEVPVRFGVFDLHVFRWSGVCQTGERGLSAEPVALTMGALGGAEDVLVRVHSECMTGEVLGSLRCDCRLQLEAAQAEIARVGRGAILYLRQEGRGIGLANKIRAYKLQAEGHDTLEANRLLGLPDDARDYGAAAAMLDYLGIHSIHLLTNSPAKVAALRALGVRIARRAPIAVDAHPLAAAYLETKRVRSGHLLPPIRDLAKDAE